MLAKSHSRKAKLINLPLVLESRNVFSSNDLLNTLYARDLIETINRNIFVASPTAILTKSYKRPIQSHLMILATGHGAFDAVGEETEQFQKTKRFREIKEKMYCV